MNVKHELSIPRIIGALSALIGVLAWVQGQRIQGALLLIAGLLLVLAKKNKGLAHWAEFVHSWQLGKKLLVIALLDALFWLALGLLSGIAGILLRKQVEALRALNLNSPALLSPGVADAGIATFKNAYATSLATLAVFVLLAIIAYALSRGMIWLTILNQEPRLVFFRKFFLLNIIWLLGVLAVFLFVGLAITPAVAAVLFLLLGLLFIHLTTVLHYCFVRVRNIRKALSDAFRIGLGKMGRFVHAYCYVLLAYVIVSQVFRFARGDKFLIGISFIILLLFMAWYRLYLGSILKRIV